MEIKKENRCLAISILAIIISAVAICKSTNSFTVSDMAFVGIIISVLAILVTTLIGWQIFTLFDTKNAVSEILKKNEEFSKEFKVKSYEIYANVYGTMMEFNLKHGDSVEFINFALLSVKYAKETGNIGYCNALITASSEVIGALSGVTSSQKATILSYINSIKDDGEVDGLQSLRLTAMKLVTAEKGD